MTQPATSPTRFIGADVGKAEIVLHDTRQNTPRTIPNTPKDLAAFAADLDAKTLATDAEERHASLARWQAPDPDRETLQALVLTRTDLVAQRTANTHRLAAPGSGPVQVYLETIIAALSEQIEALEKAMAQILRQDTALKRAKTALTSTALTSTALTSIKGIGDITAILLLALMPELGRVDRRQATSLAGLAPHPNQSGTTERYRRTKGGRPEIKQARFLSAMTAARFNPVLKQAYQRLIDAGKKPTVAIVAIMRRLLVIANARLRDAYADEQKIAPATQEN